MGTPIDIVSPGIPNLICWGSGKPFGDVYTPSILFVTFSDVELTASGLPFDESYVNQRFACTQVGLSGELWRWRAPEFRIDIRYSSTQSYVEFVYQVAGKHIFEAIGLTCVVLFNNIATGVLPDVGKNGTAVVDFDGF